MVMTVYAITVTRNVANIIYNKLQLGGVSTMVTPTEYGFDGLSTDEKPIDNVKNGQIFYEIDKVGGVNRIFKFDEEHKKWILQ